MPTYFITAIDTDAGKTVATGLLARHILRKGQTATTMKIVQTGCDGDIASDLEIHRDLMNERLTIHDHNNITNPYLFKHPASPHLSANMEGRKIETDLIKQNIASIEPKYDYLFVEGAGGLLVPLNEDTSIADFIQAENFKTILVSSSKLGSINHTLLTLEVMKSRGIDCVGLIYNHFPAHDMDIVKDSAEVIKKHLKHYFPYAGFVELPIINQVCSVDFGFDEILIENSY